MSIATAYDTVKEQSLQPILGHYLKKGKGKVWARFVDDSTLSDIAEKTRQQAISSARGIMSPFNKNKITAEKLDTIHSNFQNLQERFDNQGNIVKYSGLETYCSNIYDFEFLKETLRILERKNQTTQKEEIQTSYFGYSENVE